VLALGWHRWVTTHIARAESRPGASCQLTP
jgi:hypothetical protein